MTRFACGVAGSLVVAGSVAALSQGSSQPDRVALRADAPGVVSRGAEIYATHCASCHGADLEGQADWQTRGPDGRLPAPPHDASGHTWHHDADTLFRLTKYGVARMIGDPDYASNMPAYEDVLTDDDIVAVLRYIKSTWPEEIRAMHDDREPRE
ncbi:cytochrome c [Maribius pontilimi]|uniref:Cytochrome c n=1 Tax=Palleronia pontilimi TaxID=1964209 RepID=A0A934M943_9RHOB|nr:c-type cytochrome [Palleronia pontilimi]MBJ3762122.1 cytochrome c [Palleronia pontilimi]